MFPNITARPDTSIHEVQGQLAAFPQACRRGSGDPQSISWQKVAVRRPKTIQLCELPEGGEYMFTQRPCIELSHLLFH